ncbi:MAG: NAD-dependent epimerase/dehydratase family protein [Gammaproteobacteria bacterium]
MRCLILGGGEFIGSHLCEELLAHHHEIKVLTRATEHTLIPTAIRENIELIQCEFSDKILLTASNINITTMGWLITSVASEKFFHRQPINFDQTMI